ncbi:MAG: hypothetical protein IKF47_01365 [Bacilli bacterium]|nr:hypothetical protein [Bacilli bacterium]
MAIKKIKDKKVDEPTTKIRVTEDRINDANSLDVSFIEGNQNKANKEKILKEKKDHSFLYGIVKTLVLFLIVAVLFVFAFMYARDNNLLENIFHIKPQVRVQVKEKEVKTMDYNYLFIGDYHTDGLEFDNFYKPYVKISNEGYTTSDILDDLREHIYVYNPTDVFIELGSNDLTDENSISEVVNNLKKIIRGIQNNRSLATIYVESLYPINDTKDGFNSNLSIEYIKKVNKEIESMCKSLDVTYIDMYKELSEDDLLKEDYTDDGVKLNSDGYKKVFKVINRYIEDERD